MRRIAQYENINSLGNNFWFSTGAISKPYKIKDMNLHDIDTGPNIGIVLIMMNQYCFSVLKQYCECANQYSIYWATDNCIESILIQRIDLKRNNKAPLGYSHIS